MNRIERNGPQEISHAHPEPEAAVAEKPKPSTQPGAPMIAKAELVKGYDSVQRTLRHDPSQADRLIGDRLRGCSSTDREIVMRAVAQRGNTGIRKYADAEQVLRTLRSFKQEERGDILASMKAGTRFADAVKDEQAALKLPVSYEAKPAGSPVAELRTRALANSKAQAAKVSELSRHVMALNRAVGKVNRGAELIAGAGSAAGLVGASGIAPAEALARRNTDPLKKLAHRTVAAGDLMQGELSDRIAKADRTTQKFLQVSGSYTDARNKYDRAVQGNDFESMAKYSKEMGAAAKEMGRLATSLADQAKSIVKLHKDMDHATVETAITLVLSCVGAGAGGGHALHGARDIAKDIAKDALIERAASEAVERASH